MACIYAVFDQYQQHRDVEIREMMKNERKGQDIKQWPLQTDLPHLHMPCPEIHGPWWFQQSLNHTPTNPPTDSEPSLKSLCCCQPWQEPKEAPNCPNYQKLQGMNSEWHSGRTQWGREEGESMATRKKGRRVTTVKMKARDNTWHDFKHNTAWAWLKFSWKESSVFVSCDNFAETRQCGYIYSATFNLVGCLYKTSAATEWKPVVIAHWLRYAHIQKLWLKRRT